MYTGIVRFLLFVAIVFLVVATLLAGGVITGSGWDWLLPGGLATLAVAWFVSLLPVTATAP